MIARAQEDRPAAENVAWMLWRIADAAPERPAVHARGGDTTYGGLRDRAAAVAHALGRLGVRDGDRVAVYLDRGAEAAAAIFGVLAAGAVAVVLNEKLRPRQIDYMLTHSGARLLLGSAEVLGRLPRALEAPAAPLDVAEIPPAPAGFVPVARDTDDLAQIIYTSGSTGLPKGVMISHGSLHSAITTVVGYLGLNATDRIASLLPFSSVYGLNQLLCAVLTGATLVVENAPMASQIVAALREARVTVLAGVPPLWMQLLSVPSFRDEPIASLRVLQNAGGHLPPDAVRRVRAAQPHARLFLQYGMTEIIRSTFLPPEQVDARPGSMGRAMPGSEVAVLREDGTPCDPGEVGELFHAGPTVALGYWNDPEATQRVFATAAPRPGVAAPHRAVRSGDMVRADEEGYLYFVGRRDRMIKSLGYRVGPDEIVDILHASGQVREALIDTEPDEQRGQKIIAHVVLAEGGTLKALQAFSRTELPRYMQPAEIRVREALPRTASGKHDLLALREEARPTDEAPVATVA